jgi:hypothetical protein
LGQRLHRARKYKKINMSNKQTSVQFLWEQLKQWLPQNYSVDDTVEILSILKQANEIHMEEICDAHYHGQESDRRACTWDDHPEYWAAEYYLKTFKNQQ